MKKYNYLILVIVNIIVILLIGGYCNARIQALGKTNKKYESQIEGKVNEIAEETNKNKEYELQIKDKVTEINEKNKIIENLSIEVRELKDINSQQLENIAQLEDNIKKLDLSIKEIEGKEEKVYYGAYQWFDRFSELINDNPIDKDYYLEFEKLQKSIDFSTSKWVELESKYTKFWEDEMNNAYNHLLGILDLNDQKNLMASQDNWLEYIKNESDFVKNKFIHTGWIGNQGYVQLTIVNHKKYKERAIELLEYIFIIEDKNEFLYNDK